MNNIYAFDFDCEFWFNYELFLCKVCFVVLLFVAVKRVGMQIESDEWQYQEYIEHIHAFDEQCENVNIYLGMIMEDGGWRNDYCSTRKCGTSSIKECNAYFSGLYLVEWVCRSLEHCSPYQNLVQNITSLSKFEVKFKFKTLIWY